MNLLTQKKNALLSADCLIEAIFLSAELPRSQEALQMNDSLAKIMQKKNALLSADCLVEAASLSTGQRRSRAALQVKDALAKSVAALEEENPKIGDAYNLLNKIDGSSRPSGSKDQDAWAGLVYVIENMLQVSKNLKESGISFLAGGLLSVCSELGQASGLLNYRSVTKEKIGIVMERLPIIKASADQLRGLMQSALSGIQEYLALT